MINNEIAEVSETSIVNADKPVPANGIAPLAQLIASGQVSTDQVEKMMELQERWEANEARKAYYADISKARAELPMIHKTRANAHLRTTYADLDAMIAGAGPVLGRNNLSFTFEYDQAVDGEVSTFCITTHSMGHTERVKVVMPVMKPMTSKTGNSVTNQAQMVGIAMTYGRRYAFSAAFGIATGDDSDANVQQTPAVDMLDAADMAEMKKTCDDNGKDYDRFLKWASSKRPLFDGLLQAPKSEKAALIAQIKKSAADKAKGDEK